ncbi:mother-specific HO expression [Madurella fahalii]|uniref:Mother-specific HO expression n=1 Tax=Madurella fahalii TaxID=1157608 RepID=A0ABQ0FXE9_9PEZI
MRNKLVKARPSSDQKSAFSIHRDSEHSDLPVTVVSAATTPAATPTKSPPNKSSGSVHEHASPRSTLTPASEAAINSAMTRTAADGKTVPPPPASSLSPRMPNRMNSTIRTVPSFEDRHRFSEEESSTDGTESHSTSRDSGFSSSVNSKTSMSSSISQHRTPNGLAKMPSMGRLKPLPPPTTTITATHDGTDGLLGPTPSRTLRTRSSFVADSSLASSSSFPTEPPPPLPTELSLNAAATEAQLSNGGWDNSVGKAGLGKTGRVINRLVSDNEALKRDIQIERLRAEESRQAARLLEDKLERVISDYESRLLEANVAKTLLARKERQVESLQDAVELERKRAVDAAERERIWKEEMERTKADAKKRVDEATNYAALCEGRYNAISSHWRDQGEDVERKIGKMRAEVGRLVEERRKDDGKIETLRELCDQQDGNIRELKRQKEEIQRQFERYKRQQEEALVDIKRKADEREREQERTLQETREVLDKLKWALNIKATIEWAQ